MSQLVILIGILIGLSGIYIKINNEKIRDLNNYIVVFICIVMQLYTLCIDKFTTNYQGVAYGAFAVLAVFFVICYKVKHDDIEDYQDILIAVLFFSFLIFCGVLTYASL